MSTCKYCGRHGLTVRVNRRGVCTNCAPGVEADIASRGKIVIDNLQLLFQPINPEALPETLKTVFDNANHLMQEYQIKDIETIKPLPSEIVKSLIKVFEISHMNISTNSLKTEILTGQRKDVSEPIHYEGIFLIWKGKKWLDDSGISEVRYLRMKGEFDKTEEIILQCTPTPAVADEYRKVKSARATLAKKQGDWQAVILHLEAYVQYAEQVTAECIKQVNQAPPSLTATEKVLLDLANQKNHDHKA